MNIVLCRIDERLVHGQVMTSWTKQLQIKRIIVVDDDIAKDEFTSLVLTMAAPSGVDVIVKTVNQTFEMINNDTSSIKTMLLFKTIKYAKNLFDTGVDIKSLNIGNTGSAPNRTELTRRVFMSAEEIAIAKELSSRGIDVYLLMLHTDSKINIKQLI